MDASYLWNMLANEQLMESLRSYFAGQPVKQAYLFGSFARGVADESSDVDILVELDHSKPIGLGFVQMSLDLEALLGRHVDLVTTKGLSPHVKPFVDRDKKLIYARA
jgi:predicted nucleotidyltransferase